jgi:hypothetical protein
MSALVFIESPLQLLNAVEAIKFFKVKEYEIIIRLSGNIKSDKQIINVVDSLNLESKYIKFITINSRNHSIKDILKIVFYRFRYFFVNVQYVFVGNFESGFFKQVIKQFSLNSIVYLDDGAKALNYQPVLETGRVHFFSTFNLSETALIHTTYNNYSFLKTRLTIESLKCLENKIVFLGQKLVELDILTEKEYVNYVYEMAERFKGSEIEYIPHRGETSAKLERINRIPNVSVHELDYPVELYGLYNSELPGKIISFYSTAIYTMSLMYGISAYAIRFNYNDSEYKDAIDMVYSSYEKNNRINFIDNRV